MARTELSDRERLQPSLLDRLTDKSPTDTKDTAGERYIDVRRLREIILRDLGWLLNTANNEEIIDPALYPHAARSTLNFGISDIAGRKVLQTDAKTLESSIKEAIYALEPRIIPGTLEVTAAKATPDAADSQITMDIRGELWATPVPLELYLRTRLDVADGDLVIDKVM
ncbi:type VI secretion system baseplate subunit TssE [Neptunicoccus cionae]|mgnify:CR=1 FL=1|uniref:type VI secretion system baseplate subunit TssE n=1 Tax=Neptunicoccus cionae TaxID=2035344 RepID=UPI000C762C0C|nr:type VI secretion system baseplate subunit TssE [Amylibacter cionae]MBR9862004.1 type VI secretion system baseplate subunit TssE [Paracoccaceae bacterium]PLS20737.1 type VI secretion system baseplate subunit TssE [Amylibacter cionae]